MSLVNVIHPQPGAGYATRTLIGEVAESRTWATYFEAVAHMRSKGLCQLTSAQGAQRGHVEEWVPEGSKAR